MKTFEVEVEARVIFEVEAESEAEAYDAAQQELCWATRDCQWDVVRADEVDA